MDEDAADVIRRWVTFEQGGSKELAEKVVATLKPAYLLSYPNMTKSATFSPQSNADLRRLWKRVVANMLGWVERRPNSNEGVFFKRSTRSD